MKCSSAPGRGRWLVLVASVLAAVTVLLGPAGPAAADDVVVEGPFTGNGETTYDEPCTPARNVIDGGGEWTGLGAVAVHLDFCVDLYGGADPWPITGGAFEIVTSGGTLTGDVSGYVDWAENSPEALPVQVVLTVTGGTGTFSRATGILVIDAVYRPAGLFVIDAVGAVSGSVSVPPPSPTSPSDCKHGGWRHLADHEGRPFRSQGHCIAWVRHNTPG